MEKYNLSDEKWMEEALLQAQISFEKNEVPVGAVIVLDGKLIASAHNLVESTQDSTRHAEIECIRLASQYLGNWRLLNCILYTTLEPCSMCGGAVLLSRLKKVVYGATDFRHGACGGWTNFLKEKHPIHNVEMIGGLLADKSAALLKSFFVKRREENGCSG